MAKIYNSECTKGLAQNARIQQNVDKVPNELAEKIVPTFETNPAALRRCNILKENGRNSSGSVTLYTTPANQDFYLCGGTFHLQKDVACDNTFASFNCYIGGAQVNVTAFRTIPLTVFSGNKEFSINPPLKIDRNTNIALTATSAAGNFSMDGSLWGYVVESSA